MKKPLLLIFAALALAACSSSDDNEAAVPAPDAQGQFTDPRDSHVYTWVRYAGLDWTTDNSHYNTGDANTAIYATPQNTATTDNALNDTATVRQYGYLYNLRGAQAAVPDGWRLPTDEDWTRLEAAVGATGVTEALHLLYGGYEDVNSTSFASHFVWKEAMGYYWTATTDSAASLAYLRKVVYNQPAAVRQLGDVNLKLSVRFVRDAVGN